MELTEDNKIAVFYDAENVSASYVPSIKSYLRRGSVIFQRAYADWSLENNTKGWGKQLQRTPITAYQGFHYGEKQALDKLIMMDAVELSLTHPEINTIVVVASDKGYYSLALKLREFGKKVLGMGERSKSNQMWINACNEFKYLDDLDIVDENILDETEDSDDKKNDPELNRFKLLQFINQSYSHTRKYCTEKDEEYVLLSQLSETMKEDQKGFSCKTYGYDTYLLMMKAFPAEYKIFTDGKNPPTYRATRLQHLVISSERKSGVIKSARGNYAIIEVPGTEEIYFCHVSECNITSENGEEPKIRKDKNGAKVSFKISKPFDPTKDDGIERNGRAVNVIFE